MRPLAFLSLAATGGCFFAEAINERPSLRIDTTGQPLFRGDTVTFGATVVDPDADAVELSWAAYACGGVEGGQESSFANCDEAPFATAETLEFELTIDAFRAGGEPVTRIVLTLDGRDVRGAGAKPADIVALSVQNSDPSLVLDARSYFEFTASTSVFVAADYGDLDDGADRVTLTWEAFSPTEVPFTIDTACVVDPPVDPTRLNACRRFRPPVDGLWEVRVTAVDASGTPNVQTVPIAVVPDQPPTLTPEVSADVVMPVFAPQIFRVFVADDLSPFPFTEEDPTDSDADVLREPRFTWSLKVGAGPREIVPGATTNELSFDPAAYPAGTVIELRVEVADLVDRPLACADDVPVCSVTGDPDKRQRQTWRLEAR